MARHNFRTNTAYPARLSNVVKRPIENAASVSITLLRLEFEVFSQFIEEKVLRSNNAFACRELVVGHPLPADRDSRIAEYVKALFCNSYTVDTARSWLELPRAELWVEIHFGPASQVDHRQPFMNINRYDPSGWQIQEYEFEQDCDWVTTGQASQSTGLSEATVRRRIHAYENEFGERLVRRTSGGHRRISISLLKLLLND